MNTELIETESSFYTSFKHIMYALMVIVIAVAIPVLSYLELSYKDNSAAQKESKEKVQNMVSFAEPQNQVKL